LKTAKSIWHLQSSNQSLNGFLLFLNTAQPLPLGIFLCLPQSSNNLTAGTPSGGTNTINKWIFKMPIPSQVATAESDGTCSSFEIYNAHHLTQLASASIQFRIAILQKK
jgi:hypothetical protein